MTILYTLDSSYGAATANGYVTLSEANSIIATRATSPTIWNSFAGGTVGQAALIMQATQQIDAMVWKGDRLYYNQGLEFPRTESDGSRFPYDRSVYDLSADEFNVFQTQQKDNVQLACALQAYELARALLSSTVQKHQELQALGIKSYSESIKNLSESYTYDGTGTSIFGGLAPNVIKYLGRYRGQRRIYRA